MCLLMTCFTENKNRYGAKSLCIGFLFRSRNRVGALHEAPEKVIPQTTTDRRGRRPPTIHQISDIYNQRRRPLIQHSALSIQHYFYDFSYINSVEVIVGVVFHYCFVKKSVGLHILIC